MPRLWSFIVAAAVAAVVPQTAGAGSIKQVILEEGRTEENQIVSPAFDAAGAPGIVIGEVGSALAPEKQVIERYGWGMVIDTTLGPAIRPGDLLAQAMRIEGDALGLPLTNQDAGAWRVSGQVDDLALKFRVVAFGPLIFHGFLQATFTVTGPDGGSAERTYQVFNQAARYNAGMGIEDEVSEALAQLFLEAGQEVMSRLNRDFLHLPARVTMAERARSLAGQDVDGRESELRTIGLSLAPEAVEPLLRALEGERDEDDRAHLIDALGNLGDPAVVPALTRGFQGEDKDCRFAILDALNTLGGEEARRFIREVGAKDAEKAVRLVSDHARE